MIAESHLVHKYCRLIFSEDARSAKDHYGTSRAGQAEELAVGHAVDTLFTILMYSILSMAYACPSFFVR